MLEDYGVVPQRHGNSNADGYAQKVHDQHGIGQSQAPGFVDGFFHGLPSALLDHRLKR
jgi:hypothetical protein